MTIADQPWEAWLIIPERGTIKVGQQTLDPGASGDPLTPGPI
ncbi:hypothetical protein [Brachybacterium vulturis]